MSKNIVRFTIKSLFLLTMLLVVSLITGLIGLISRFVLNKETKGFASEVSAQCWPGAGDETPVPQGEATDSCGSSCDSY